MIAILLIVGQAVMPGVPQEVSPKNAVHTVAPIVRGTDEQGKIISVYESKNGETYWPTEMGHKVVTVYPRITGVPSLPRYYVPRYYNPYVQYRRHGVWLYRNGPILGPRWVWRWY